MSEVVEVHPHLRGERVLQWELAVMVDGGLSWSISCLTGQTTSLHTFPPVITPFQRSGQHNNQREPLPAERDVVLGTTMHHHSGVAGFSE